MTTTAKHQQRLPEGLNPDDLKAMYTLMVRIREFDDRAFKLQRQGRIGFYAPSYGEEAAQIGTAYALAAKDWVFSSYRQPGVAMRMEVPLQAMVNNLFGNSQDIAKGKQMPIHYTCREKHFVSISSVIGTQIIQAAGCAIAARIKGDDAVTITYLGDGATSSSDFHSGMNFAAAFKAPCLIVIVNNQYAISLPVSKQTAVEVLADKAKAYGMPGVQVDGNDILAVYEATCDAIRRARTGDGPTLLELKTYRLGPHSSSDDPSRYRPNEEAEAWKTRDPIMLFRDKLMAWGLWSESDELALRAQVQDELAVCIKEAESLPQPAWETMFEDVYAEMPNALRTQMDDILTHESGLEMTNEGEFPL